MSMRILTNSLGYWQVYTWGYCKDGQLGHGDEINVTQPKIVAEPRFENETFEEQASHTSFRSRKIYVGPNYMLSEVVTDG